MRARYRFAERTLAADSDASLRFIGKCLDCRECYADTESAYEAQGWCLKHAGGGGWRGWVAGVGGGGGWRGWVAGVGGGGGWRGWVAGVPAPRGRWHP
ncbi:DUF7848 domain-containing protein [Streptomyces lydicus]